jgi:hypothetical protein
VSTPAARADRDVIREAATMVRHVAIQDRYAGAPGHPAVAFAMCALLDELALHCGDLPVHVRAAVARHCREIVDGTD